MPRFVLLYHELPPDHARASHWDLMLEAGDSLRTWSLAQLPRDWQFDVAAANSTGNTVGAEKLVDHRLAYLDYEGAVSGDRGAVTRVDSGTYFVEAESPHELTASLRGQQFQGRLILHQPAPQRELWTLVWQPL